jgi:hypothetical protein
MVWTRRAGNYLTFESLKNFNEILDDLIREGKIEEIRRELFPEYCLGHEGYIHVLKRLK